MLKIETLIVSFFCLSFKVSKIANLLPGEVGGVTGPQVVWGGIVGGGGGVVPVGGGGVGPVAGVVTDAGGGGVVAGGGGPPVGGGGVVAPDAVDVGDVEDGVVDKMLTLQFDNELVEPSTSCKSAIFKLSITLLALSFGEYVIANI
uniref:Glycine-rich protein n=1 Tax=Panagrolaimus sp. JU765 TaxID=591449 RepID=A0AC34QNM1_9BILA